MSRTWRQLMAVSWPSVSERSAPDPLESYVRLTICYLVEYSEDWGSERSYIREDKVLGSLDRLHELTAQTANW